MFLFVSIYVVMYDGLESDLLSSTIYASASKIRRRYSYEKIEENLKSILSTISFTLSWLQILKSDDRVQRRKRGRWIM